MGRRKKPVKFKIQFYIYYDKKTGDVYHVTHTRPGDEESALEISLDDANRFLSGEYRFSDYSVGYNRTADNKIVLGLIKKLDQGYLLRNNLHEWIIENDILNPDCLVEWNYTDKSWYFSLSEDCKLELANVLIVSKLVFFVTLETDFDFLVRTIVVDTNEAMTKQFVQVPFETNLEIKIDKISISSSIVFKSYKLKVINE
jgi:hypothetical protein